MNGFIKEIIRNCEFKNFTEYMSSKDGKGLVKDPELQEYVILHGNHSMIDYVYKCHKKPFQVDPQRLAARPEQLAYVTRNGMIKN